MKFVTNDAEFLVEAINENILLTDSEIAEIEKKMKAGEFYHTYKTISFPFTAAFYDIINRSVVISEFIFSNWSSWATFLDFFKNCKSKELRQRVIIALLLSSKRNPSIEVLDNLHPKEIIDNYIVPEEYFIDRDFLARLAPYKGSQEYFLHLIDVNLKRGVSILPAIPFLRKSSLQQLYQKLPDKDKYLILASKDCKDAISKEEFTDLLKRYASLKSARFKISVKLTAEDISKLSSKHFFLLLMKHYPPTTFGRVEFADFCLNNLDIAVESFKSYVMPILMRSDCDQDVMSLAIDTFETCKREGLSYVASLIRCFNKFTPLSFGAALLKAVPNISGEDLVTAMKIVNCYSPLVLSRIKEGKAKEIYMTLKSMYNDFVNLEPVRVDDLYDDEEEEQ